MRHGVPGLLLAVLLATGCAAEQPEATPVRASPTPTPTPPYNGSLEPAAAVLAVVPSEAQTVAVTDFDQVRKELGLDELSDRSPAADVAAFWQRADAELPLLTTGLLRPADDRLSGGYGFTELDVAWEAHFADADGHELGWVLRFRDGTDMAQVQKAAADPATPLAGAVVDAEAHLASSGATDDPARSWEADPALAPLVGQPANSTYVARGCDGDVGSDDVDELGPFSVQFEGSLATARLGTDRQDLFIRMRLGQADPAFAAAYAGGVADPATGRIGYVMTDPAAAARLALAHQLPFATCA